LTLVQTGKMAQLPIFLFGREFWERVVNFDALVEEGVIAQHDLNLFRFVETAEEAWDKLNHYYATRDRVHLHRDPPPKAA
jgi:predicted Rossmann-fold nucleotide-binding protein